MNHYITATNARKNFYASMKKTKPGTYLIITHEGVPSHVLMSFEEFEGWMETMDILSDPKEAAAIRAAMKDKDDVVSFEEFKKNLGV